MIIMASSKELQAQLDKLKQDESKLRKQIAKQKRQEEDALIKAIGKCAKKRFYTLKSLEDFENFFNSISIPKSSTGTSKCDTSDIKKSNVDVPKTEDKKKEQATPKPTYDASVFAKAESPVLKSTQGVKQY